MSVVGASGHARNIFFFLPQSGHKCQIFQPQRVYTVVLYPSCASYKSELHKPFAA